MNKIIKQKGYCVSNIDSIIVAQKPKLAPYIDAMREKIAKVLDISPIEFMIQTGYLTLKDINPVYMLKRVDKLEEDDLRELQLFIDFLISKRNTNLKGSGEINDI